MTAIAITALIITYAAGIFTAAALIGNTRADLETDIRILKLKIRNLLAEYHDTRQLSEQTILDTQTILDDTP